MIFPTSPGGICIPFPGGENSRWWIEAKGLDSREYGSPERLGFPESNKKMLKLFCTRVVGVVVCKVTLDFSPCTRLLLFFFLDMFSLVSHPHASQTSSWWTPQIIQMSRKVTVHDHQSSKKRFLRFLLIFLVFLPTKWMNTCYHLLSRGAKSQNLHALGFFSALVADSVGHAMAPRVGVIWKRSILLPSD